MGSESGSVHEPPSSPEDRESATTACVEASTDGRAGSRLTRPAAHLRDGRALLLLALILIVAAAVRLVGIGQQSFSIDEISELRIAHAGIAEIVTFGDGIPPLYNLLVHFLLPLGDLAGRVLSALFGAASVAFTWAWARRIAGNRVGLYAAGLMALSPFTVQLSQEGRAYGLMVLLAAASLWSLWTALEDPSPLRWVRWGLISALGLYTHYVFAVLIAAWLIVSLVEVRWNRRGRAPLHIVSDANAEPSRLGEVLPVRGRSMRGMWIGIGTLGLLALPISALLPGDMVVQIPEGPGGGIRPEAVMYAGYRLVAGFSLGPSIWDKHALGMGHAIRATWIWIALLAPVVGVLLAQGYRALDRIARRRLLALSVAGVLLGGAAIQMARMSLSVNYFSWLVVPLAVCLAVGLGHVRPRWRGASAVVLAVVAISSVIARFSSPHHQFEDARAVAAYLESSDALDAPVLVLGLYMARPIEYYIDRSLALALPDQWDPDTGRLGYYPDERLSLISLPALDGRGSGLAEGLESVRAHTRPGESYYLVYSRPYLWDPHGELLAALITRDGLTLVKSFAGVEVHRGVRSG